MRAEHSHIIAVDVDSNGKIQATGKEKDTFGWSAEQILLEVFNVATTRNYYLTRLVGGILDEIAKQNADQGQIQEKVQELRKLDIDNLNDNDPMKIVIKKLLSKLEE